MITSAQLEDLKQLEAAATPGPWTFVGHKEYDIARIVQLEVSAEEDLGNGWIDADDAAFIAAARTAVPLLIAEVERLQAESDATAELLSTHGCESLVKWPDFSAG